MTPPRRHIAGQVVLLTRRCFHRCFFLRPDNFINNVIRFETARASIRHGQAVHGFMAMSNHIHQISTDTTGNRSKFMRDAMREISRARNSNLKRRDSLWDGRPFGDTVLLQRETIERKLLYIWLNPVHAGLVRRAQDWPGFKILPRDWGKTFKIQRPEGYYGRKTPETITFTPMPPPGYEEMSLEEVREHFENLLKAAEEEIHKKWPKNKRVKGALRICKTNPFSSPTTPAPFREMSPRFACKDGETLCLAIQRYKDFLKIYQRQRLKWMKGKKVEFPCGTVQLKHRAPIRCKPPDADEPGLFQITRAIG